MTNYYFDTSVWINYFDEKEFYHKYAVKWLEKVKNETLVISDVIEFEMRKKEAFYKNFLKMFYESPNFRFVNSHADDQKEAHTLSKTTEFAYGDLLHLLITKRYNLIPVTSDIHHWPRIARMLEIYDLKFVTDIDF